MLYIVLAYAFFSLTFPLGKYAMHITQPIFFVAVRMIFAGSMLLIYQRLFTKESFRIAKKDIPAFAALTLSAIYLSYCLQYWALPYMTSIKWALFYTLSPFISSFFSYIYFKERLTLKKVFGLIIGFSGIIPAIYADVCSGKDSLGSLMYLGGADLAVFFSVVAYSYGWVVSRKLVKSGAYSSVKMNGISMFFGGILAMATSPLVDSWCPSPVTSWKLFFIIVISIASFNIASYLFTTQLLKRYSSTFITFMSFTDPLYVAAISWMFLGEQITWHFFLSMTLIFSGLLMFYQEELRASYAQHS